MSVEVKGFQRLNFVFNYRLVIVSQTIGMSDDVIGASASEGEITLTLPPAADVRGKQYMIKRLNSEANNVIVDADGSELIDQAASVTLSAQDASVTVFSTGTKWLII